MNSDNTNLSIEGFLDSDWKTLFSSEEISGYRDLQQGFRALAEAAKTAGQTDRATMMSLFTDICSMAMDNSSLNEPFRPFFEFSDGSRSLTATDLSEDALSTLGGIWPHLDEPWLKGRISDLLWLYHKPKNVEYARAAISAYCQHSISKDNWYGDINHCWERAIVLSFQIRSDEHQDNICEDLISAFKASLNNEQRTLHPCNIAELIEKHGFSRGREKEIATSLLKYAQSLKHGANQEYPDSDYLLAQHYLKLAEKLFHTAGDNDNKILCLALNAECYELEAERRLASDYVSYGVARSFFEDALQAYRRIPNRFREQFDIATKLTDLQKRIEETGKASLGELAHFSHSTDIAEIARGSREHVSQKGDLATTLAFFTGFGGLDTKQLEERLEMRKGRSFFSDMFSAVYTSADGRIIAKSDENTKDEFTKQQMLCCDMEFTVAACIIPALDQVLMEHTVTRQSLLELCHYSPVVPHGREKILSEALFQGFDYNFDVAIHLLCPQFEHLFRSALKAAGAVTTHVDSNGIENEHSLNTLVNIPEAASLWGEDMLLNIKTLFTEPVGFNLRNNIAHGLISDVAANSRASAYAWWLTLKIVTWSLLGVAETSNEVKEEE
ncbi:MAG: DUF4209 domain-containing protein [Cellvibrionales bacterium]|nr:DUF4209 domain-containing protein [Cellvibrionales bacterium]